MTKLWTELPVEGSSQQDRRTNMVMLSRAYEDNETRIAALEGGTGPFVLKAGDTMTGDLTVQKAADATVIVKSTGVNSEAFFSVENDAQRWTTRINANDLYTIQDETNTKTPFKVYPLTNNNLLRLGRLGADQLEVSGDLVVSVDGQFTGDLTIGTTQHFLESSSGDSYLCAATGDLGVGGTGNPAAKLHVFGTGQFDGLLLISGADLHLQDLAANSNVLATFENDVQSWQMGTAGSSSDEFVLYDLTNLAFVVRIAPNSVADSLFINSTGVGLGKAPSSALDINLSTEDLDIVDAGSASATEQDWIEVQVGGNTGYIRVFSTK